MNRKQRAHCALDALAKVITDPTTELVYRDPFELLISVVLSAQCTDVRVNMVTPALFEAFPDAASMATAEPEDVLPYIRSISYPNNKSRHLVGAARLITREYGGKVPETVEELVKLPGVGSKTAQVVASVAFEEDTLAVDTHIFRVANRIGLVPEDASTPDKVSRSLKALLPQKEWGTAHHLLILHGRYTCTARSPACEDCVAAPCCKYKERLDRLPAPVQGLDPRKGRYWCATRDHYFDEPDMVSDRQGVEQISCPRCGSMNVFFAKTGRTTKRVRDYRV